MYGKVLAAVNEHLNSEVGARYAVHLASACGAKLYACFVAEKGMPASSTEAAEGALRRLFEFSREFGLEAESIASTGEPAAEIGKIVRREGIDIVFASTRRVDVKRRFYRGTVARSLLLKLPCSVALVRVVHMGRLHPAEILVPLKAHINHIGERAYFTSKLAEGFGSKLFFFHAPKPITKFFHGEIHLTPLDWERRLPGDIERIMDLARKHGIELEGRLSPGGAARGITIEAAARRHDLIIMGASERGFVRSIFDVSPVEKVLRETPCDLIIHKPRHEDQRA